MHGAAYASESPLIPPKDPLNGGLNRNHLQIITFKLPFYGDHYLTLQKALSPLVQRWV
jgi:hypothetical protein